MPLSGTPSGSCRSTPGIRRCLAPTGTLSTEIGNSMFYSKSAPIRQVYSSSSTTSLDSTTGSLMKENLNPYRLDDRATVSRFPKLQECAHFHYDRVDLDKILVSVYEGGSAANEESPRSIYQGFEEDAAAGVKDYFMTLSVQSHGKTWLIRRTYRNLRKFDRQLHKCVHDRKVSHLVELPKLDFENITPGQLERVKADLASYLARFSQLTGSFVNCAPVLNWLELDNRGYRLVGSDDSDVNINTPAVAACRVTKRYVQQAGDELTLEVGDMISVVDCPPSEESMWWRGKKNLDVGFFPSDCVQVIGGGNIPPPSPSSSRAPVLRRRGKLIAFFRSFLSSRPSRRRLKESGILKERVYGCDLGEHLLNTSQKVPAVLVHCATYLEEHGTVDGIYRLSGISSNIQRLRLEFDAEKVPNLLEEVYVQDIHSVASVLKLYFRELPNPLLTYQLYEQFVQAIQAKDEMRLLKIHDVVAQLPPPHFRTLEFLMRHLARIASSAEKTGMNSKNLAIVWAPNLLRSSETESGVEALRGVGVCAIAVEYLIKFADLIFSNRLQSSSLLTRSGCSAKNNRPKSLAVSTPTKLLSLDEARALSRPSFDATTFIEVGAGPENLPKYHTVIDIPSRNKRRNNQKSPSTWRSLFASKNRKQSWPSRSPLILHSPLTQSESLSSPATTSSPSGSTKRRKLRLAQSVQSLCLTGTQPGKEFARAVRQTESSLLRTPVTLRRSQNANHNRSLSHDSYFDEIVEMPVPQTVIDVIKTVPCSTQWTESGVLLKLSFDEPPEGETPERKSFKLRNISESGEMARNEAPPPETAPKPAPPTSYIVPVEVHPENRPHRRRKTHRTLSPEFLRRNRPPPSGLKRSLSASPKAVHHPPDHALQATNSSPSVNIRCNSKSGRKSFRRSTSEEDLPPAGSPDQIMDVSGQEEAKTFESTEMELFDEICAEIYGKEADFQSGLSLLPGGPVISGELGKADSLHDIAEILEEEELAKASRADSVPAIFSGSEEAEAPAAHASHSKRASSSSFLGLGSLCTTPPSPTRSFSTYYFNGDSRPVSVLFSPPTPEHHQEVISEPKSPVQDNQPSPTYYFGQATPLTAPEPDQPEIKPECQLEHLRAVYFGLATSPNENQQILPEKCDDSSISRNLPLEPPAAPEHDAVNEFEPFTSLPILPSPEWTNSDAENLVIVGESHGKTEETSKTPETGSISETPSDTDITPVNCFPDRFSSVHVDSRAEMHEVPVCPPETAPQVPETGSSPSGVLEYVLILQKPVETPETDTTSMESPPSVRLLRNRFETTSEAPEQTVEPCQTLKQKLHTLIDLYRDATPGEAQPKPLVKKNLTFDVKGSNSPVLPEKPRHLRAGAVPGGLVVKRRKSGDEASEQGSLTSLCSIGAVAGTVETKASKVSQMRQMYEHSRGEPSKNGAPGTARPRSTLYQPFLA